MTDSIQERWIARLIETLADPQAPLELPCGLCDLNLFIETAVDYVKEHRRAMPDDVRERFEQAVRHARDILESLTIPKLLN